MAFEAAVLNCDVGLRTILVSVLVRLELPVAEGVTLSTSIMPATARFSDEPPPPCRRWERDRAIGHCLPRGGGFARFFRGRARSPMPPTVPRLPSAEAEIDRTVQRGTTSLNVWRVAATDSRRCSLPAVIGVRPSAVYHGVERVPDHGESSVARSYFGTFGTRSRAPATDGPESVSEEHDSSLISSFSRSTARYQSLRTASGDRSSRAPISGNDRPSQ